MPWLIYRTDRYGDKVPFYPKLARNDDNAHAVLYREALFHHAIELARQHLSHCGLWAEFEGNPFLGAGAGDVAVYGKAIIRLPDGTEEVRRSEYPVLIGIYIEEEVVKDE